MRTTHLVGRCRSFGVVFVLVSLLAGGPGQALSASGDAGSMFDAGDVAEAALEISAGEYTGSIQAFSDEQDWYRVQVEAGQTLKVEFDALSSLAFARATIYGPPMTEGASGRVMYRDVPEERPIWFPVPRTGTWYVQVNLVVVEFTGTPADLEVPYTLAIETAAEQPHHIEHFEADTVVATARWDRPGDVVSQMRIEYPRDVAAIDGGQVRLDMDLVVGGRPVKTAWHMSFEGGAPAAPGGMGIDIAVREPSTADGHTMVAYMVIQADNASGTMHWRGYGLRPDATLGFIAGGPHFAGAITTSFDASWHLGRHAQADRLGVAGSSGPRDRNVSIASDAFVAFVPDVPGQAFAEAPDGVRHRPDPYGRVLLVDPQPGTWRFVDGPTTTMARDTEAPWLHGSRFP